jgi:hypothetical protein
MRGMAFDSSGNLFVADTFTGVRETDPSGGVTTLSNYAINGVAIGVGGQIEPDLSSST